MQLSLYRRGRAAAATAAPDTTSLPLSEPYSSIDDEESIVSDQILESLRSRDRLRMAIHHMTAFVLFLYCLYAACRGIVGWDPLQGDPPPPTYTIEIPGITSRNVTDQRMYYFRGNGKN